VAQHELAQLFPPTRPERGTRVSHDRYAGHATFEDRLTYHSTKERRTNDLTVVLFNPAISK
jgi:hypothetical protein